MYMNSVCHVFNIIKNCSIEKSPTMHKNVALQ